jgi:hypothetical protein
MKTGKKTSLRSYDAARIARQSTGSPARSLGCGSPKARLRAAATRLATALVDLLLDCSSLLIRDDNPGIVVTTVQDLEKALSGESPLVTHEGERACRSVAPALPTDAPRGMFEINAALPL